MKDIILYIANSDFDVIVYAVAGVTAGFGFSMVLSLFGKGIYTTFNLIERSSY